MMVFALLLVLAAPDAGAPLIPRAAFFGPAAIAAAQVSPDGTKVALLKPDVAGVAQLVVRTLGTDDDVQLTTEKTRAVRSPRWTEDGAALLYLQDHDGDERFHVFVVDLATRTTRDLTPWPKSKSDVLETSPRRPETVLITTNRRDARVMDVVRVNWKTGAVEADTTNPRDVTQWLVDSELRVRGARATLATGATEVRVRDTTQTPWRVLIHASLDESVRPFGFTFDGKGLVLATSISSDTERIVEKSLTSGTERVLTSNPRSDALDVLWNRASSSLRAVGFDVNGRREWATLDWAWSSEAAQIDPAPSQVEFINADRADQRWLVQVSGDTRPPTWKLWDRKTRHATTVGSAYPSIDTDQLSATEPVTIAARDGLSLQGYLTLPRVPTANRPLVLLVHGGPWWKDRHAWNPQVQWLANRGAAVLQVNFRGSTGSGKRFVNAGNKQWGLSMQDDLSDAVAWAIREGHADATRVAIMGQSYGGYATLTGLSKTPELYRCGVDLVGPANLFTLLASVPPWWKSFEAVLLRRVGNPADPKDKALLTAASPVNFVERITAPLLVGHGRNDPRVKATEAEQIITGLRSAGREVTFIEYPDEGHGLARPQNRLDFAARTEQLFAACLGTRAEPLADVGSSAIVR